MNKEELRYRVQEGFFDLAPDMFDKIVEATEQPVENVVFNISDKKKSDHFYTKSAQNCTILSRLFNNMNYSY